MKRNNQQRRLNDLDGQRSCQRWILGFQGNVTQRMDMEHALVVIGRVGIGRRPIITGGERNVLIMMVIVTVNSSVVIEVHVRRHRVDCGSVLFIDLMRMRLRGAD